MGNQDFGRQTDNARADILRSKAQIVGAEQTDVLVQPKTITSLVFREDQCSFEQLDLLVVGTQPNLDLDELSIL